MFNIVFICDDSGSMRTPVTEGAPMPGEQPRPFSVQGRTRWTELAESVKLVIGFATYFDSSGVVPKTQHLLFI